MLIDSAFGGAYSLIQRVRYLEVGDGVLVADLSHTVAEFCGPNRAPEDARGCRSVKFSYVQKSLVGGLAHASLALDQPDALVDGAMRAVVLMREEMRKVQYDLRPEMFYVLAVRESTLVDELVESRALDYSDIPAASQSAASGRT